MSVESKVHDLRDRVHATLDQLRGELLDARNERGHWTGQLAASALSTATAVSALAAVSLDHPHLELSGLIDRGIEYLRQQQNADGGFGDTDRSYSNIATSYLVLAASALAAQAGRSSLAENQTRQLEEYIRRQDSLAGLRRRYGKDKTFVVPIMTNLAIAGLVSWNEVPRLPFEAAAVPQSLYRLVRMPVVSYAIPALVAIGQARHFHGRAANWPLKTLRSMTVRRTLRVLSDMQPESGGYLEATPLTSFVVMSLAATGRGDHPVSRRGVDFLRASIDLDGSWPIDTNLATWVTSLAIHALACDPRDDRAWCNESLVKWHLGCQHKVRHPFTGASPGGWGWTDLSGAVPDGDDTPGAILALLQVNSSVNDSFRLEIRQAVASGVAWLVQLQNRDGGWPTFCRGWGKLPFDRSSTDLTAHAIRAIRRATRELKLEPSLARLGDRAIQRGQRFLVKTQQPGGEWLPLWFGNQDELDDINPIYGTARVLLSVAPGNSAAESRSATGNTKLLRAYGAACSALLKQQNKDGGWGGGPSVSAFWAGKETPIPSAELAGESHLGADLAKPATQKVVSTMEETAIAVEGLATVLLAARQDARLLEKIGLGSGKAALQAAIISGVEFLLRGVAAERHREPWPIGFYFAKLWYHERLYPWLFTVSALGKFLGSVDDRYDSD